MSASASAYVYRHHDYPGTKAEAVVLLTIADSVGDESGWRWYGGVSELAMKARLGENTTRRALSRLASDGWLVKEREGGGTQTACWRLVRAERPVAWTVRAERETPSGAGGVPRREPTPSPSGADPEPEVTEEELPTGLRPVEALTLLDPGPKTVEAPGYPEPFPVSGTEGETLGSHVAKWGKVVGLEGPATLELADRYEWLVKVAFGVLGRGPFATDVYSNLVREYVEVATEEPLAHEAWMQLRRNVKTGPPVDVLRRVATAVDSGAGIDEQYRDDPRALTKFAQGVRNNRGAK